MDKNTIESLLDDYAKVRPDINRDDFRKAFAHPQPYGGVKELTRVIRGEIEKRTVAMELMVALGGNPTEIIRVLDGAK